MKSEPEIGTEEQVFFSGWNSVGRTLQRLLQKSRNTSKYEELLKTAGIHT